MPVADELNEAILEILTDHSLTLPQLVDKLKENEKWRRVDPRLVKSQLQKLEDTYQVMHERDGAAVRFRWFSPRGAEVIAQRNDRQRKARITRSMMLIREGLTIGLQTESLALVRLASGGVMPMSLEELNAAELALARDIGMTPQIGRAH